MKYKHKEPKEPISKFQYSKYLEFESGEEILEATKDPDWRVRKLALQKICPCRVLKNIEELWERIFEMVDDPHERVRDQAIHSLIDGSPRDLEHEVISVMERKYNDPSKMVRKKVRRCLTSYRKTGIWNVD